MNNKGLLPKATLKLILAVISILFLVGFLVSLFISNSRNKDLELAESSLEYLIERVESGVTEVEIWNPKSWGVASFSFEQGGFPDYCSNNGWENCICMCGPLGVNVNTAKLACPIVDSHGIVCLESDFLIDETIQFPPLILMIEGKTIRKKEI